MIDKADFQKTVIAYDDYIRQVWDAAKLWLRKHGTDLDERRRNWKSHELDMTSLRGYGPIVIKEYLHDERAPKVLVHSFEVPREEIMR